jgi:hypothetical protein
MNMNPGQFTTYKSLFPVLRTPTTPNSGFIGLKYLTYAVFYSQDENPDQFFETWTGTLKEV